MEASICSPHERSDMRGTAVPGYRSAHPGYDVSPRHGRARPGHPRLSRGQRCKTWMPGTSPGMTNSGAARDDSIQVKEHSLVSKSSPASPAKIKVDRWRING